MPYDDDDDLFGEEFDFVDDDDSVEEGSELEEEKPKAKPAKKRPAAKDKEKAEKPPARAPKRPRSTSKPAAEKSAPKRESRRSEAEPKATEPRSPGQIPKLAPPAEKKGLDSAPVGYLSFAKDEDDFDDEPAEVEAAAAPDAEAAPPAPAESAGPPADHLVHIYEYGKFKRTIGRKFTDEQAVGFAEEYTRTGKPYGRYAIATPDDEEPSPTFQGASKG